MQVQSLAVLGGLHQFLSTAPVFVLCVLSQQFFLQSLDALGIAFCVQVGSLFHSCKWSPALWIYDVGILERVSHVMGYTEGTAGLFSVLSGNFLNLRHDFVAFRMSQNNFHTHTCHQANNALRNGERLAVGRRVSPCHSQLFAL